MTAQTPVRKAANLSLDKELLAEAKALGVNVSRAAEAGLSQAVRQAKSDAWLAENAHSLRDYNRWIAENGLPLDRHRLFDV